MKGDHIRVANVTAFRYAFWGANLHGIYGILLLRPSFPNQYHKGSGKLAAQKFFDTDINYLEQLPRERPLLT